MVGAHPQRSLFVLERRNGKQFLGSTNSRTFVVTINDVDSMMTRGNDNIPLVRFLYLHDYTLGNRRKKFLLSSVGHQKEAVVRTYPQPAVCVVQYRPDIVVAFKVTDFSLMCVQIQGIESKE